MHIVSPCLLCGPISCELCSCAHTWINVCLPGQELCEQRDKKKNRRKEVNYFVIYYSLRLSVYFSSYPLSLSLWANCYDDFFYNFTICAQGSLTQTFFSVQCFVSLFLSPPDISFLSLLNEFCPFDIWRALFGIFYTTYLSTLTSSIAAFDIHCLEFILMSTGYLAMFPTRFTTKD